MKKRSLFFSAVMSLFAMLTLTGCPGEKYPSTKPVIDIQPGATEGSVVVNVTSDSPLTSVTVSYTAGDVTKELAKETNFGDKKTYKYEGTLEYPDKVYAAAVKVDASNVMELSNSQTATISIPEPAVDPDAPVLYNWAKEFVSVSKAAWEKNVAANKIRQHTEEGGLITDEVHYIPDQWSDPDAEGVWTVFNVAGKTYTTGDMLEIATRAYLMLRGYDAATKVSNGGYGNFDKLSVPATLTAEIPEVHGYLWGGMPYNESGETKVGGEVIANGGPIRKGDPNQGTAAGLANKCRMDLMDSYAQRHLVWPFTHDMVMSNMCGYNNDSQRGQVNNEFFGNVCVKRFYMMMVGFFDYMLTNELMDVSTISESELFDCTLFGNEKWD